MDNPTTAVGAADSVLREKIALLYRNTPTGCISVVFSVAIVMLLLWSRTPHGLLIPWAIAVCLVAILAYFDFRRFSHSGFTDKAPKIKTALALASSVSWGSAPLLLMPAALEYQVLMLLVICIIAFSGTVYFSYHTPAFYAFVLPLLLMTSVAFLLQGGGIQIILAVGMIGMLLAVIRFGKNFNDALTRAITVSLENEALVTELTQQKETAIKANLAKTRFLASASHDLRQPMHTIGLLVSLLRHRSERAEDANVVEKIHAAIQAMENLFTGLLDISKLDAGMVKPTIENFPIANVLQAVHVNFTPQAEEKGLQLRIVASSLNVKSDAVILERMVANLVANAVRYTQTGKILVGCRRRGASVSITVCDTGIGIPHERREEIFQEFVQLSNPERDRNKGLGLGLSIVKRSADLLGHTITLHSKPGRGSCFAVTVPIGVKVLTTERAPAQRSETAGVGLFGLFILVIDDEQDIRFAMESILNQWGCHVLTAGSHQEAIDRLTNHLRTPDLLISDYRLRDNQTGVMAVEAVRRALEEAIPAIIITGDITAEDLRQVTELGLPLAHKPISAEHLKALIIDTLSHHQLAAQDES
ncbi:MAG: hybrid sensor histidine kinase/response regulator [Pseudomonadota bacterium]|nr:hybrid sensor histidine kinase/response regulator [Pseudomonadota bacterium]